MTNVCINLKQVHVDLVVQLRKQLLTKSEKRPCDNAINIESVCQYRKCVVKHSTMHACILEEKRTWKYCRMSRCWRSRSLVTTFCESPRKLRLSSNDRSRSSKKRSASVKRVPASVLDCSND